MLGPHGPTRPGHDASPRLQLQWRIQLERDGWLGEGGSEPGGEGMPQHEVATHGVIHRLHDDVGEFERGALRECGCLRRAEGAEAKERDTRKLSRQRGSAPGVVAGRREVDDRRVHQ